MKVPDGYKTMILTIPEKLHDDWIKFCKLYYSCKTAGRNNGANEITSNIFGKFLMDTMKK